jgi:hypothetical protein
MSPSTTNLTATIAIASAFAMSFSIKATADDAVDISGEVQLRFSNSDAGGGGFTRARTKLIFKGDFGEDLKWKLGVKHTGLGGSDDELKAEEFSITQKFGEGGFLTFGGQKGGFMAETNASSTKQLTSTRSSVNDFFTTSWGEGIMLGMDTGTYRLTGFVGNGFKQNSGTAVDGWEGDIQLRGEYAISGDLSGRKWLTSLADLENALIVGAGYATEFGTSVEDDRMTLDLHWVTPEWNVLLAYLTRSEELDDTDGIVVQAGKIVVEDWEAFARYESLDSDLREEATVATVGLSHHIYDGVKMTLDLMEVDGSLDSFDVGKSSSGFAGGGVDGEKVFRCQIQYLF